MTGNRRRNARRRWLAAAALALAACERPAPDLRPRVPEIAFEAADFDFGRVEQGTPVKHTFKFRNAGGADLVIEDVRTSCGCTAAVPSGKIIPPGGEGRIETTFDTERIFGRKSKTVTVYSSDPERQVSTLTIRGEVTVDIAADPPELYVGRLQRGKTATRDVRIAVNDAAVEITGVETDGKIVRASLRGAGLENRDGRIGVAIARDAPLGRFSEKISVRTTSSRRPAIEVPVVGIVEGDVVVSPPQLAFGQIKRGEPVSQSLMVKNTGAKAVALRQARVAARWAGTKVDTVRDGREYRVTVTIHGTVPPGRMQANLELHTDHPEQPVVSVPIGGIVKERK